MRNASALVAHDRAIEILKRARDRHGRGLITDSELAKAVEIYKNACRIFESEFKVEKS